jgi:hypothetical protein
MTRQMCQSCGMPLKDKVKGTEKDGTKSEKYCYLCYENGKFTQPSATAKDMQEVATSALKKKHWPGFLIKMATNNIPKLERWQNKN